MESLLNSTPIASSTAPQTHQPVSQVSPELDNTNKRFDYNIKATSSQRNTDTKVFVGGTKDSLYQL